jgi:hypothetical protein
MLQPKNYNYCTPSYEWSEGEGVEGPTLPIVWYFRIMNQYVYKD